MSPPPRSTPVSTTLLSLRARLRSALRRARLRAQQFPAAALSSLLLALILLVFLLANLFHGTSSPSSQQTSGAAHAPFLLGAVRVNITPTEPVYLSGFATRTAAPPLAALLDPSLPLFARALVVRGGEPSADTVAPPLILVSLDVIAVPRSLSTRVRDALCQKYSLPRERVHIIATHTHSGAALSEALAPLTPDDAATARAVARHSARVERCIVRAVDGALAALEPAFARFDTGKAELAVNRREVAESSYRTGDAVGHVDHSVPVLYFTHARRADSGVRAVLFSYAAHATVLTSGTRYSPDLPGVAAAAVEAAHPGAVALFAPGCAGDQNVYPRGSESLLRRHGGLLARSVLSVMAASASIVDGRTTGAATHAVVLPFAARYGRAELRRRAASSSGAVTKRAAALLQAGMGSEARTAAQYNTSVSAWRIGSVVLALLPGEPTVGYAALARAVGADVVLGYVDDVMGYIGTVDVIRAGGREGGERAAWYYGLPAAWTPDVEDVVMSGVRDTIKEVRENRSVEHVHREARWQAGT